MSGPVIPCPHCGETLDWDRVTYHCCDTLPDGSTFSTTEGKGFLRIRTEGPTLTIQMPPRGQLIEQPGEPDEPKEPWQA